MVQQKIQLVYSVRFFIRAMMAGLGRLRWQDWLVMLVFSSLVASFSSYIYLEHIETENQIEQQRLELNAKNIYQLLELAMERRLLAMDRMAARFNGKSPVEYRKWKKDAANYFNQMSGFSAIQWVDKNNNLQWVYPEAKSSFLYGKKLNQGTSLKKILNAAVKQKKGKLTLVRGLLQGDGEFFSFHPTFDANDRHSGFFVGVYNVEDYFQSMMVSDDFSVYVEMDGRVLYSRLYEIKDHYRLPMFHSNIRGSEFLIEVYPRSHWSKGELIWNEIFSSFFILLLVASCLLILTVLFLMSSYRNMKRSLEEKRGYQKELLENFERVAASEQLLYQAQEISKIGNWSFDVVSGKIHWSDQMYKIFPEQKAKGEPNFERHKSTIHPEDRGLWENTVNRCIEDGRPYIMHFRAIHDDEKEVWVEARGQGSCNERGEITNLFGTCQDITEKKKMEETVQQQERMAHHQARLASIGQLAAGVGHEINNPLTIISGYLELIEAKVYEATDDDEKLQKLFGKLKLAVFRIRQITQGLRNFARQEDDEHVEMNLKGEINKTLAVTEEIFMKEGVKVIFEPLPENLCFFGPPGQIQQVLLNLMMNARDAMASEDDKRIILRSIVSESQVCIQVEDCGKGIPENIQEKIFEPFFTTKDVNQGTGLGLSLSQKIMKDHRGELRLVKSDHNGTIFEITLPARKGNIETYDNEKAGYGRKIDFTSPSNNEVSPVKALIVDDEPDILSIVSTMLSDLPIKIDTAANGSEALKKLSEKQYDILLTDLKMPKMDGETFLGHVFHGGLDKDMKIFVMTGGVGQQIENNFRFRNRVDGYFLKPFEDNFVKPFEDICVQKGVLNNIKQAS